MQLLLHPVEQALELLLKKKETGKSRPMRNSDEFRFWILSLRLIGGVLVHKGTVSPKTVSREISESC